MEALVSRKSICDYYMDTETSVAYITALKELFSGGELDDYHRKILTKAKLYTSSGKLRVFNFKRPKKPGQPLHPDVKLLLSLFDNPEKTLWFQPRFKYEHDAMKAMISTYGLKKTAYLIFVMTPAAEGYDYIPTIDSPSKLISKVKSFAKQYKEQDIGEKEKLKVLKRTQLLENKLNYYETIENKEVL